MVVAVAVKSDCVVVPESIIMVLDFFVLFLKKDLCVKSMLLGRRRESFKGEKKVIASSMQCGTSITEIVVCLELFLIII